MKKELKDEMSEEKNKNSGEKFEILFFLGGEGGRDYKVWVG